LVKSIPALYKLLSFFCQIRYRKFTKFILLILYLELIFCSSLLTFVLFCFEVFIFVTSYWGQLFFSLILRLCLLFFRTRAFSLSLTHAHAHNTHAHTNTNTPTDTQTHPSLCSAQTFFQSVSVSRCVSIRSLILEFFLVVFTFHKQTQSLHLKKQRPCLFLRVVVQPKYVWRSGHVLLRHISTQNFHPFGEFFSLSLSLSL